MHVASYVRPVGVAADVASYGYIHDKKLIIINQLGLNLKIQHGAIVDNVVINPRAKFDDDRL